MLKHGRNRVQFIISKSGFTQILQYTTSAINNDSSSNFAVDYLVNSLGFSKEAAIITSSKVSSLKSPEKPNSVVNLLKNSGFNETQIRAVVKSFPRILSYDVDKTLKPKLEAFHEFGISGSELGDIISVHPHIFSRGLDKHIIPSLELLKSVFDDDLLMLEALKKSSWMLAPNIPKTVPSNVALLRSYGLSVDQIKRMFLRKSRYFALDPKWLQGILIRVEEKIGIPRHSPMFVHGVCAIGGMREVCLESKFEVFRSFGWSDLDILKLARKNPHSLALSELKIRSGLNFFMKELGHEPGEIASCACVLTVSLERRVIPRNVVLMALKEKKLIKPDYRILSCLVMTELQFFNKFVLPFKDEILDVYTEYMRTAGASLKTVP